jgi:hypothetical protein
MNPQRSLYGRITINSKRTDLGYAPLNQLFLRAAQTYAMTRSDSRDLLITLEVSAAKLPDSSILNREAMVEQQLASAIIQDPDEESPFEGITIGRVQEVMATPEYETWAHLCIPVNREGVPHSQVQMVKMIYEDKFPDCAPHFPRYIES